MRKRDVCLLYPLGFFYRCAGRSQQSVLDADSFLTFHTKTVGIRKIATLWEWRPET